MRKGLDQRKKKDKSIRKHNMKVRETHHPWVKCSSGKVSYKTWDEADMAAGISAMYFYDCPHCPDYHLSESRQPKPARR